MLYDVDKGGTIVTSIVLTSVSWAQLHDSMFATEEGAVFVDAAVTVTLQMVAEI